MFLKQQFEKEYFGKLFRKSYFGNMFFLMVLFSYLNINFIHVYAEKHD